LKPRALQLVATRDDASEPAKAPADALGNLPASYGEVPRLGPPRPGDLGRPILDHQRSLDATGPDSILLIPQGARLIGSYDSVVAFGQSRALIVWQRIVFPDGRSLRLDNVPATDPAGYAGLADKVDFHTWTLLKGAAVSTLLGVGANLTFTAESDLVQAIRESTQQNVSRAGDQLTSRNLNIQPTITVRPGTPVRLVVHRDLVLAPDSK
jgi:type IV secretory pathway VirB10-like protein